MPGVAFIRFSIVKTAVAYQVITNYTYETSFFKTKHNCFHFLFYIKCH